ncbi:hypothetical protein [Lachnoanaerobaculum umeaense]|jgi:hypothetical protein|uniref:Uncharacterized protein n=1 Tax=Lachnoanaerobaculum umeaense TaxID=617123 RepID=A0A385Q2L8_9FIRM|nr:hypothetical protein [Lachnoanaerobaculum umeaense]AYB00629.1 hypothetical protein D4A81_12240 [Lachnoanaerobaculum umeaense]PZW92890.1 hypothetical protein C7439_12923 [Lachnoanaerobaculum umeaense]
MEDFFKKLSIYGSIAKEEGQKIAQSALNKGKELADIAKLKRDIKIEEDIIKSYKMVIGEYVAANDLLREDELVLDQRTKILKSQEKLKELKEKLDEKGKNKQV